MAKKGIRFVDIKEKLNRKAEPKRTTKKVKSIDFKSVSKTKDIFGRNLKIWKSLEEKINGILSFYQFDVIETPVIEYKDLVFKGVWKKDDQQKKRFFFVEKTGEKSMVLRPDLLSGMLRSYFENKMQNLNQPVRLYSLGPVFLDIEDNNFSQNNQLTLEAIGDSSPIVEIEMINTVKRLLDDFGFEKISVEIDNIGCEKCKEAYEKEVKKYYRDIKTKVCTKCKKHIKEDFLKVLECKDEKCVALRANLKSFDQFWCTDCKTHFAAITDYLDFLKIEHSSVAGLNKYTSFDNKIVFKINVIDKERKYEAAVGSRHDELIRTVSNNGKYGVGCNINTNLLFRLFRDNDQKDGKKEKDFSVFLIQIGDTAKRKAFEIVESLRKEGILAKTSLSKDSLRAQISMAEKEKVNCILIIGQEEVIRGEVILRDFQSGLQESVSFAKLIPNLIKRKLAN